MATRIILLMGLQAVLPLTMRAGEPAKSPGQEKPQWQRMLQGEDARKAAELERSLTSLESAGEFEEAFKLAYVIANLRSRVQGKDHWETVNARWNTDAIRCVLQCDESSRKDYATIRSLEVQAAHLNNAGRYREALMPLEKALAIRRKVLGEDHPATAYSYNTFGVHLDAQGRHVEAQENFRKALAVSRNRLGEEHSSTTLVYNNIGASLSAQGRYGEAEINNRKAVAGFRETLGDDHLHTASSWNNLSLTLFGQGKHAEALDAAREALKISRKLVGENHEHTAKHYASVGYHLRGLGRYADAEVADRAALAISCKVLGEEHPTTAAAYDGLAVTLTLRGKYPQGEDSYRKALAVRRKVLGEEHPATARTYNNLASNLNLQGEYAKAEEMHRKALAIFRKVLGEEHLNTAYCYGNLALTMNAQGKYAAAETGLRKSLAIRRNVSGETHADTATGYNNLAINLNSNGKHLEAEKELRKALAIRSATDHYHPATATNYNNLGQTLSAQGKYEGSNEAYGEALSIRRKLLGEEHPDTALIYYSLAHNLKSEGKHINAEENFRKALIIWGKALGEDHPTMVHAYNDLAGELYAQGLYAGAEEMWRRAAETFTKVRLRIAGSGIDRATKTSEQSPDHAVAAIVARNGEFTAAWHYFEGGLARGTWDDINARLRRPAPEQSKEAELIARLDRLDQLIEKTISAKETSEQKKRREELLGERLKTQDELVAFTKYLEETYGAIAGQVYEREQIQAALSPDSALIGWLDIPAPLKAHDPNGEHWAFLLRSTGEPVCVKIRGRGPKGEWTDEDSQLPGKFREMLQQPGATVSWKPAATALRSQRLAPLEKHLAGVRHLVILPSTALRGVPVEAFANDCTVSYTLSGSVFGHLKQMKKLETQGLLAVADPVFDVPIKTPLTLPPGGLLITQVLPNSNAKRALLQPGDVLLRYAETELETMEDLTKAIAEARAKEIDIVLWRDGKEFGRQVLSGELGVVLAKEPASKVNAKRREVDQWLASTRAGRDGEWATLPGTRAESEALVKLFGPTTKLLADSQASEQALYDLAHSGELSKFRYVHLATHGVDEPRLPMQSAVILARDNLPDPGKQLDAGLPIYDGRLTAEEVLRNWNLQAELVTLSACQSALGKYERSEGYVGFAQALLLSGARSVCLSLWKVDDAATALLMERFYANLLRKREGLKAPMGKAMALAEAKTWLRDLPLDEATKRVAKLTDGVARAAGRKALPLLPSLPAPPAGIQASQVRPFAHPYYWAAFVLIGDPD